MATEVSAEIKRRIEARRAARGGTAATPVAETPAGPVVVAPDVPEPVVPSIDILPPDATEKPQGDGVPPSPPSAPKPAKAAAQRQPKLEPDNGAVVEDQPVSRVERIQQAASQPKSQPAILSLLEEMRRGEAIVIVREDDATWHMTSYAKFIAGPKPTTAPTGQLPLGFKKSLLNPDYGKWEQEVWLPKSFEQKLEYAVEIGLNANDFITEEEVDGVKKISQLLTLIRLVPAVRAKLGMSKYKPGFDGKLQRKEAETKARAGESWL